MNISELPALNTWIGTACELSAVRDTQALHNPNTGAVLVESRSSSAEQVDRAIALAHETHQAGTWEDLGVEGRAPFLLAFADLLDAEAESIAQLDALNSGVPIRVTRMFAASNGATVRSAVNRALELGDVEWLPAEGRKVCVHRVAWGPTALIMPWNAPSAMAVKKMAYALVAGATVVLKPSPASPFSTELVVQAAMKAGIPHGVVSLVLGGADVGHQLVSDKRIRAISMTGSTPTGRAIAVAGGQNFTRLRLELGSNNAVIVRDDADIAEAAALIVSGAMKLSGQWCEAPRRVIVASTRLEELVAALQHEMEKLQVGSSLDEATEVGPVAFEGRKAELVNQRETLRAAGARIIEVGTPKGEGWFMQPTIVVADEIDLALEIFGPMLTVQPSTSDAHAIALANAGHVGLAAYVFSADMPRAHQIGKKLLAGEVKINGTSVLDMSPLSVQSFFGESGIGGHGDADVLDFFTGKRVVGVDKLGLPI